MNCFFPEDVINRYQRADRALAAAVAEMYATGTSTRKVQRVAERMGAASERGVRAMKGPVCFVKSFCARYYLGFHHARAFF